MNAPQKLSDLRTPAQPPTAKDLYENLKRQLEGSKAEFLPLFGNNMANVDAFVRVVLNAVLANPDLLGADRRSLIASCMKAAQDGLMPDGREAVLNIYNTKVKHGNVESWVQKVEYLPMVGGFIKLMYASGEVASVDAAAVFEKDRFVWRRGDDPKLEHEPTLADDCGPMVAAYCVVKLTNGELKREVMPMRDIKAVRAASKSGTNANSPWVKWPDQMAIKSVIKRINKQLPKTDKFDNAEASDNAVLGFAATPESVATIAARAALGDLPDRPIDVDMQGGGESSGDAGTPPAPAALEHQPAQTLPLMGLPADQAARQVAPVAASAEPAPPSPSPAPAPAERTQRSGGITFDIAGVADRMRTCNDLDTLDVMADQLNTVQHSVEKADALRVYAERRAVLTGEPVTPASRAAATPARRTAGTARVVE